ncbi:MAG: YwiC-like family protein [Acidobacteria bacterium]|nr:YwiC-like family protein [Acidobacteriota bacterium]
MTAISSTIKIKTTVPAKSVALPVEHGAWGFLFEPALAGLILAPTPAAPFILLLFVGGFLARQPLKFLIGDWLQGRSLPRTELAYRYAVIYGAIAGIGFIGMKATAPSNAFLPIIAMGPLAAYLISQDISRQARELVPELAGAFALTSSITVFALAGGWDHIAALVLWAVMLARLIPSVLYVRSRLRLEKGKIATPVSAVLSHVAAFAALGMLYYLGFASILTLLMSVFLAARAAYGLSPYRQVLKAKVVGIWEVVYGVVYALTVVIGHYTGI